MKKLLYKIKSSDVYSCEFLFIILFWSVLWFSIDTYIGDLEKKNFLGLLLKMRVMTVLIFITITYLIIFTYLKNFYCKIIKTNNFVLLSFFLYFTIQVIGLYDSSIERFNFTNLYLIFQAYGVLSIFFLIKFFNLEKQNILKYLFYLSILILSSYISTILFIQIKDFSINQNNEILFRDLYSIIQPGEKYLDRELPRITGISRMLAVINIILLLLLDLKKKKSFYLLIPIIILSSLIWGMQSRGTIICFFISSIIIFFILNKIKIRMALFLFLFINITPIVLFQITVSKVNEGIIEAGEKKISESKDEEFNDKTLKNEKFKDIRLKNEQFEDIRVLKNTTTSGRVEIWKRSLSLYNYLNFFGYGPQGDRYLLSQTAEAYKYSNNASNAIIYSFLSAGYLGAVIIILIYLRIFFIIYTFYNKKFYKYNLDISTKASFIFLIFFLIRSIIENSFSLFSIDFLLFVISIMIIENFLVKPKKNI